MPLGATRRTAVRAARGPRVRRTEPGAVPARLPRRPARKPASAGRRPGHAARRPGDRGAAARGRDRRGRAGAGRRRQRVRGGVAGSGSTRDAGQRRIALRAVDSVTVVPPGARDPSGGRTTSRCSLRTGARGPIIGGAPEWPRRTRSPAARRRAWADCRDPARGATRPALPDGGESAARRRMERWLGTGLAAYAARHDDLPGDATSRLSADLHFGCLSPLELAVRAGKAGGAGGEAYVRQLCWRDFHAQVTAAFPALPRKDYRPRRDRLARGRACPRRLAGRADRLSDRRRRDAAAGGRGYMHNRARLLVASFLTKQLSVHWTAGARHFFDLLVDGDIANNAGNWQWVAGTGNDTRPEPAVQPAPPGAAVRPGRRLTSGVTCRSSSTSPAGRPRPVDAGSPAARLPGPAGRAGERTHAMTDLP